MGKLDREKGKREEGENMEREKTQGLTVCLCLSGSMRVFYPIAMDLTEA